jgi:uncharacterized protein YndB with AHSA1/START domain
VGGRWSFVMHAPHQGNFVNECEFTRIESPALIEWKRYSQPIFRVLAIFEELAGGQTLLEFRMIFDTKEECDKVKKFAVEKNEENFDKLEAELTTMR